MKHSTLLKVAAESILKNKMRTLLTMLGIVIGVGAVIVMVAIGNGAQPQIEASIRKPRHEPHHDHADVEQRTAARARARARFNKLTVADADEAQARGDAGLGGVAGGLDARRR